MDVKTISEVISTVGFPVVMCVMMAWFIKYQMDVMTKTIDSMTTKVQLVIEQNRVMLDQVATNISNLMEDVHKMMAELKEDKDA